MIKNIFNKKNIAGWQDTFDNIFLETFLSVQPKMQTKVIFSEEEENSYAYEIESDSILLRTDYFSNGSSSTNKYYLESVK